MENIINQLLAKHNMGSVGTRAYDLCLFGVRNDKSSDLFDDVLGVAYREVANGPIRVELFRCTTDPGKTALIAPGNPKGVFHLKDDFKHKAFWKPGLHKGERPALRQNTTAVGWRDNDRDSIMEKLVVANDAQGVNLHDGMRDNDLAQKVGRWSEGCTVTSRKNVDRILWLVDKQKANGMGDVVSFHLFRLDTNPEALPLFKAVGL